METMKIYEALRGVPAEAQKTIGAGKLKGFTDINPMWRIKRLTEVFGVCGIGWTIDIVDRWVDNVDNQVFASIKVALRVKIDKEWSEPIIGIGGSMMFGKGVGQGQINDECWKMAYTDAIGIACKMLGMAGDIYFAKDRTKYDVGGNADSQAISPAVREYQDKINNCQTLAQVQVLWDVITADRESFTSAEWDELHKTANAWANNHPETRNV